MELVIAGHLLDDPSAAASSKINEVTN